MALAFPSGWQPSPLGELEGAKYLIDGNAKEKDDDCNEHHQKNAKQIRVFGIDRWEKIEVFIPQQWMRMYQINRKSG